jgi:hypothetical protein
MGRGDTKIPNPNKGEDPFFGEMDFWFCVF